MSHAGEVPSYLQGARPVDFGAQIERLARIAQHMLGGFGAAVSLVDSHGERVVAGVGGLEGAAARGLLLGQVTTGESGELIVDPASDPRFAAIGVAVPRAGYYAGAACPLASGDGRAVVWMLGDTPPADLQSVSMLADFAKLAATGVAFRADAERAKEVSRRAVLTSRLLAALGAAERFETAFAEALRLLCEHYGAAAGRVWRMDVTEQVIREVCHYATSPELEERLFLARPTDLSVHNSVIARAVVDNAPYTVVLEDLARSGHFPRVEELIRKGVVCHLVQPVHHMDEQLAVGLMFDTPRADLDAMAADVGSLLEVIRTALYRKVAEERMHLLTAALDRSMDAVVITLAAPVAHPGPRIVYANASYCRNNGYELSEVIGSSPRMLLGPETDMATVGLLEERLGRGESARVELLAYRKDGTSYWMEMDASVLTSESDEATHLVGVQRDITERRAAVAAALQTQKLQAIGQITGGVAHDFNNLLAVISGNLELLEEALAGRPELLDGVQAALRATDRGALLTRSLLAFARQQPLEPRQVDVNALTHDITELLRRTLPENIDVRLVASPGLWGCEADPSQLQNALLNLVVNARDAMPQGGLLTIETSNRMLDEAYASSTSEVVPGDYVMLAVSDTGTGMAPEVLARAFEPFFTTKPGDKGTGLGLSMVYGFLKQSRGHVNIYSEPGQGTTVRLYLPRFHGAAEQRDEATAGSPPGGTATVLVVEDSVDVRRLTCVLLRSLGYEVLEAAEAGEAIEVLMERDDIAVLLTDVVLPGPINGTKLAAEARALRPEIGVLYMSGYTENAIMHQGRVDVGVRLLQKPFRRRELAEKIRAALDDVAKADKT